MKADDRTVSGRIRDWRTCFQGWDGKVRMGLWRADGMFERSIRVERIHIYRVSSPSQIQLKQHPKINHQTFLLSCLPTHSNSTPQSNHASPPPLRPPHRPQNPHHRPPQPQNQTPRPPQNTKTHTRRHHHNNHNHNTDYAPHWPRCCCRRACAPPPQAPCLDGRQGVGYDDEVEGLVDASTGSQGCGYATDAWD